MDVVLVILFGLAGGFVGGIVGVGGGILFVPALTIFLDKTQVQAEATSLVAIVIVALAGGWRQYHYGNVRLRDAIVVGVLSPLGVAVGVVVSNTVSENALRVGFAALCIGIAVQLTRRALRPGTDA